MKLAIFLLGLFHITISFILNEKNAKYLLAGYNTMSDKERESYDIKGFLKEARKSLLIIGIFILLIYSLLYFSSMDEYTSFILIIIPMLSLLILYALSKKYKPGYYGNNLAKILFFTVMGLITVGIPIYIFISALSEPEFIVSESSLKIEGSYHREINYKDIKAIKLVENLPQLIERTGGSALGRKLKGHFLSKEGKIYLNVTLRNPPYLRIDTSYDVFFLNNSNSEIEGLYKKMDTILNKGTL